MQRTNYSFKKFFLLPTVKPQYIPYGRQTDRLRDDNHANISTATSVRSAKNYNPNKINV